MKKRSPPLLISLIGYILYGPQVLANLADQCPITAPIYTKPLVSGDSNLLPVHIESNKTTINHPEQILFSGNVGIKHHNSTLTADEVQLTQRQEWNKAPLRTANAIGNVNYSNNEINLHGLKAWSNLNTKDIDIYHGNYKMVGRQGRGNADIIKQRGDNRYTILKNGSFTSCLPGDNSWSIIGSELIHDRKEQIAKVWNARFKIGRVPIFYSPYLQIPVGDRRRSGFLIPNIKYGSSNSFEFSVPYYLNLAPGYDATITPNYINKRNIKIQTEFRYLTVPGKGLVEFDWLPKDRAYNSELASNSNNSNRWLLYWHHNGVMNRVWRFKVDYTKVSDLNYFNDLDSKYGSSTDSYATQKFSFGYADDNWDTAISYKQFQVFNTNSNAAYRTMPQLSATYYKNYSNLFNFKVFNQLAKFINVNDGYPETVRLHIEPTLNLPLGNRWGKFKTEAKLMATHYQQKNIDVYNKNIDTRYQLKSSVRRVLPQFKADGSMVFERNMNYKEYCIQTLEPRLQYLYVPYRNQNDIGIYDSAILQTDYYGLFRDRTYSGLDRISSANKLTSGVTTRIYDALHVEQFNASVGKIYYFSRQCSNDITGVLDSCDTTDSVVWAGDGYWRISNQWGIRCDMQCNSRLDSIMLGDAVLEYRSDENHILQLNYRYASPRYIDQILGDVSHPNYQQGISQVGITANWPLVTSCSLTISYYYDTKASHPADQLIGIQYNTCCWAVNVGYERKIIGWNSINDTSQYDNKLSFNIELRGLNSNSSLDTDKTLTLGILPYQRVF